MKELITNRVIIAVTLIFLAIMFIGAYIEEKNEEVNYVQFNNIH